MSVLQKAKDVLGLGDSADEAPEPPQSAEAKPESEPDADEDDE